LSGSSHRQIKAPSLADYLAVLSRAIFQAGLSWAVIDRQWDVLCEAFDGFDPRKVARYGDADVKRIMSRHGILHSERKIRTTIRNAQTMLDLDREHHGFGRYLKSFKTYDAAAADIKQRFSYVGEISAYYFLFRVGEPVPSFSRWIKTVEGDHPRIREMAGAASHRSVQPSRTRSLDRSSKNSSR
jgi:3-methyladenine DNA glycosylase Tag